MNTKCSLCGVDFVEGDVVMPFVMYAEDEDGVPGVESNNDEPIVHRICVANS